MSHPLADYYYNNAFKQSDLVPEILNNAVKSNTTIVLPKDFICNDKFSNDGNIVYKDLSIGIPPNYMGLDIGIKTITEFKDILKKSDHIIWNGPLGVFEFDNFSNGSKEIMKFISELQATTIIGGGDTAACCEKFNLSDKMYHISSGGGASLEFLEGKQLPGLFPPSCDRHVWRICGPANGIDEHPDRMCARCGLEI